MRRFSILVVTMFAILWQTVGYARAGVPVNLLADLEHATLHWQAEGHHHHEDGSYHSDNSSESVQHVLSDHLGASAALVWSASHDFPAPASLAPAGLHDAKRPAPDPEALLRPPRSRS